MAIYNLSLLSSYHNKVGCEDDNVSDNVSESESVRKFSVKVSSYRLVSYNILSYNKTNINEQTVETLGLFRSVIFRNGKLLAFSPPKSLPFSSLIDKYPDEEFIYEEIIDGTMINLFYDHEYSKWELASKKKVGAETAFFTQGQLKDNETFRHLFLESCAHTKLNFELLPKNNCYSFVFQHPKNRIVTPIKEPKLYLIAAYTLDSSSSYSATEVAREALQDYIAHSSVRFPAKFEKNEITEWAQPYELPGIMVHHRASGSRSKIRNEMYEHVRLLRGNQPKLQYHYLVLLKSARLDEYLYYYPEMREIFMGYNTTIAEYTTELFRHYIDCYSNRKMPLKEFPYQFRTHMYTINQNYKNKMYGLKTIHESVHDYINSLEPAQLMFALNYKYRTPMVLAHVIQ
jgi:hypothetical protein